MCIRNYTTGNNYKLLPLYHSITYNEQKHKTISPYNKQFAT